MGPGHCLPGAFRGHVSGRPRDLPVTGLDSSGQDPSPEASFSLSGRGSVLIKMPSLRPWPHRGRLPEKPRPLPHPQPTKAIFQPLSVHSKLRRRCIHPSRGWKREENAKGPVQVPNRFSPAGSCPVHGLAL